MNFSSYYQIDTIPLVFQPIQLILSLKNTGTNQHIAQNTQIANLGGHMLSVYLNALTHSQMEQYCKQQLFVDFQSAKKQDLDQSSVFFR